MKIGIITIFDCINNSGAFLQAYSLKLFLEKQGHQVYHIVKDKKDRYINTNLRRFKQQRCTPKNPSFIRYIKEQARYLIEVVNYKKKNFISMKDFKKMNEISIKQANEMGLDLIICGSDEIWNLKNPDVGDEFFFAKNISAKKKITYAVSAGNCELQQLIDASYPCQAIKNFDEILVRDEHTRKIVEAITGRKVEKVCDPTFLVNMENLISNKKHIKEKYMLVYSYYVPEGIIKNIQKYAKKNGLKIVAATIKQSFADINIFVNPLQFVDIVKNAQCIYTSTLHGSIFSILNMKRTVFNAPFIKVEELIDTLGQTDRIVDENVSYDEFEKILNTPIDERSTTERINAMRQKSQNTIKALLKEI